MHSPVQVAAMMNKESIFVVVILIVIMIPAVKGTIAHLKGEGSCCGGPKEKPVKKRMRGEKLCELLVGIDGMHCANCKNRIERHLDELDGVVAKVNLEKKQAVVSLYKDVDCEIIKDVIEKLDFHVVSMEIKN